MSDLPPHLAQMPFHVMAKPIGPICNLTCSYCFYVEKSCYFPSGHDYRMSPAVLEAFIRKYIESQSTPEVNFAWQGGEPTLLGVDFFRTVVELQQKYANGKRISNCIQTNCVLIDDEWCALLKQHEFLVGASIDGPRELHDHYRVDARGNGSFDRVIAAIERMQAHGVQFNSLTVVNNVNAKHPQRVYTFLRDLGVEFMQFIPLVERAARPVDQAAGLDYAAPPDLRARERADVSPATVPAKQFGIFLSKIFDTWVRNDVGRVFVQLFDVTLGNWVGQGPGLCVFAPKCGNAVIIEHNGDIYSCDHFMYPEYRLGNIVADDLHGMVCSEFQLKFGSDKEDALPQQCRECRVLNLCRGACPKHRFLTTSKGEPGLNYLCAGYRYFFNHVGPYMSTMAQLLRQGRAPADIMQMIREQDQAEKWKGTRRNDPCPCGSGKKYKNCHGAGK
jgi:uncharacterized protein